MYVDVSGIFKNNYIHEIEYSCLVDMFKFPKDYRLKIMKINVSCPILILMN
jgi:hypothetical protein